MTALLVAENLQTNALEETQKEEKRRKKSFRCPHTGKPLPGSRGQGSSQAGCLHLRASGCCSQTSLSSHFLNEH